MALAGRSPEPLGRTLAEWATTVRWETLPEGDRERVLDTLVDTVGVALAGTRHHEFALVRTAADRLGLIGDGAAELWGSPSRLAPGSAALLNATAGHVLDFDDVHYLLHGHASTVLWPALIAVGQAEGLSGKRLLEGYVAGVGAMAAVSVAFGPKHYSVGWHSTSTIGAIGTAVGVAVALGLDAAGIHGALGAGVSMASGVRANFGTPLKPLHAGLAARGGIEAAYLAAAGVVPSPVALEGALGGVPIFGDGSWSGDVEQVLAAARHGLDELGIKPYPACRGAHYAIDAALDVHGQLDGALIESVQVKVPLGAKVALLYDDPSTGLEAKFSLPYAVGTTLAHGLPTLEHFTDDAVADPATRAVMARVAVTEDDSAGDLSASMTGRYAEVRVVTADGRSVEARVDDARGSWSRPLSRAEIDEKFAATAGVVLGADEVGRLLGALRGVEVLADLRGLLGS